jgi:hypothetical protein
MGARRSSRRIGCIVAVTVLAVGALSIGGCFYFVSRSLDRIGASKPLPPPPPPSKYGTPAEIGTRGDPPNPGELFDGKYPSSPVDQERPIGGRPARFSGYTTWVDSATRVRASKYVSGYAGSFVRVRVRIFNRDVKAQHVCACDFFVWSRAQGYRSADAIAASTVGGPAVLARGAFRRGDVYLYVGTQRGALFLVYNPDHYLLLSSSESTGVWQIA